MEEKEEKRGGVRGAKAGGEEGGKERSCKKGN